MHSVTGRQLSIPEDNLLRTLDNGAVNREHLIYYTEQRVESWLNCLWLLVSREGALSLPTVEPDF